MMPAHGRRNLFARSDRRSPGAAANIRLLSISLLCQGSAAEPARGRDVAVPTDIPDFRPAEHHFPYHSGSSGAGATKLDRNRLCSGPNRQEFRDSALELLLSLDQGPPLLSSPLASEPVPLMLVQVVPAAGRSAIGFR